jgi:hypothetical protein
VTTSQSTGVVSTPFGSDVMAVWSTASDCHLEHLTGFKTGVGASQPFACSAPAIATTGTTGLLLFEAGDGVRTVGFDTASLGTGSSLLAPGGTSPRALFDGSRYWVSYLDTGGDLVVGFLDASGALVTTTVTGTEPSHDAYQFLELGNQIWVISADQTSFAATRICGG